MYKLSKYCSIFCYVLQIFLVVVSLFLFRPNVGDVVDTFSLDRAIELDYHLVEFDDVRYHIQVRVRAYFYAIQSKCQ